MVPLEKQLVLYEKVGDEDTAKRLLSFCVLYTQFIYLEVRQLIMIVGIESLRGYKRASILL